VTDARLRRLQRAVRATLTLGVAASVTANILHARPHPISQAIAAWPPVALLITVELVSRIPVYRRALGVVRVVATTAIAAIAAWVSYHHMVGVVARYGETDTVPYLLPLSVDGLIVVASVSLVELAGRRRETAGPHPAADEVSVGASPAAGTAATLSAPATPRPGELMTVSSPAADPLPAPWSAAAVAIEGAHRNASIDDEDLDPGADNAADRDRDGPGGTEADAEEADLDQGHGPSPDDSAVLAADLVTLLPAARTARDELTREGRPVSRDALARPWCTRMITTGSRPCFWDMPVGTPTTDPVELEHPHIEVTIPAEGDVHLYLAAAQARTPGRPSRTPRLPRPTRRSLARRDQNSRSTLNAA
jgi:hypothetical protein